MKQKNMFLLCAVIVFSLSVIFAAIASEDMPLSEKPMEDDPYADINWIDLNREKNEENDGWYQRFRALFYRERTKKSLTGDDITVIETLEVGNNKSNDADRPVSIIKIKQ
jgi:hypothetical protein